MTTLYIWLLVSTPWIICVIFGFYIAYKLYHPYRKNKRKVDLEGLSARNLRIPSCPGIQLDGLLLSAEGARHLVLIAHELGAFKESKLKIARRLVSEGFSVLLFDLRNHGESSKDRSLWPMSEKFTDDVEAALRFAREHLTEIETITLYTFSFSTFPSLYILRRNITQPDGIILDSGPSMRINNLYGKFMDETGKTFVPWLFKHPAFYPLLKFCVQFFGLRMLATTWPPDFSRIKSKVLFFINSDDPIFAQEEILEVAKQVPSKQVYVCPGSSHLQGYKTDPENYEKMLFRFLKEQVAVSI